MDSTGAVLCLAIVLNPKIDFRFNYTKYEANIVPTCVLARLWDVCVCVCVCVCVFVVLPGSLKTAFFSDPFLA